MRLEPKDLMGQRFGRLVVVDYAGTKAYGSGRQTRAMWWCRCDCGARTRKAGFHLQQGTTQSCGCYRKEYERVAAARARAARAMLSVNDTDDRHAADCGCRWCMLGRGLDASGAAIERCPRCGLSLDGEHPQTTCDLDAYERLHADLERDEARSWEWPSFTGRMRGPNRTGIQTVTVGVTETSEQSVEGDGMEAVNRNFGMLSMEAIFCFKRLRSMGLVLNGPPRRAGGGWFTAPTKARDGGEDRGRRWWRIDKGGERWALTVSKAPPMAATQGEIAA